MDKHIVFVHGIKPKPERTLYKDRLLRHLNESLSEPISPEQFHVAYWPQAIDRNRQDLPISDDEYVDGGDGSGNFKAYTVPELLEFTVKGTIKRSVTSRLEDRLSAVLSGAAPDTVSDQIQRAIASFVTDRVAPLVYEAFIEDVHLYFNRGRRGPVKQVVKDVLEDAVPNDAAVCLIGHSMGSFVSLDLILEGTRMVDRFISVGSPLGISVIQQAIGLTEQNRSTLPTRIGDWFNIYDPFDLVAFDSDLPDDFSDVGVIEETVRNEFVIRRGEERDHHKSYGYLRTERVSEVIEDFLANGN